MDPELTTLVGLLLGTLGSFVSYLVSMWSRRRDVEAAKVRRTAIEQSIDTVAATYEESGLEEGLASAEGAVAHAAPDAASDTEEVLDDLRVRLVAIEGRLPAASTVDKIASVNEAVLATKLEAVEKEIDRLRGSVLSRWDVALVLFALMAALAALAGIGAAAVNFLG